MNTQRFTVYISLIIEYCKIGNHRSLIFVEVTSWKKRDAYMWQKLPESMG